jgi:DnaJ-class molecular chaperone
VSSHLTEPCKTCDGSGRVPRPRRRLPNGEPDRFDTVEWPETICDACSGSGQVPLAPQSIRERALPGY